MSAARIDRRSIATRLVFLFTLAAALLLSSGLGFFYWLVVRHAYQEDNNVLADKVAGLRSELRRMESDRGIFLQMATLDANNSAPFFVRVLGSAGETRAETSGMSQMLEKTAFPAPEQSWPGGEMREHRSGNKFFSLVSFAQRVGPERYTVQVAQDRSEDDEFRRQFALLLALVLGIGIVASALISLKVTSRSLQPLGGMVRAIEKIDLAHLTDRISSDRWPTELQPLAAAYDRMIARLDDSFRRLSQFSADLAHELRTPVGNMLGEAQVALTRERSPDEYRGVLESAVTECERLSAIVGNLLFLARAESPQHSAQSERFAGRAALEKIVAYYQPVAEEQNVTLSVEGEADVLADPMLFERAVNNLLENALRFTPAGGNIVLSLKAQNSFSKVVVRDNGSGIAPEHLPRVFDRLYQADSARASRSGGLGLALVKSIAELHRGTVEISSKPGKGTAVTLRFPEQPMGKARKIT
ncbi:MAG: heavy metal sensor histidine kinase [Verrucomicrobiota bacterium]